MTEFQVSKCVWVSWASDPGLLCPSLPCASPMLLAHFSDKTHDLKNVHVEDSGATIQKIPEA